MHTAKRPLIRVRQSLHIDDVVLNMGRQSHPSSTREKTVLEPSLARSWYRFERLTLVKSAQFCWLLIFDDRARKLQSICRGRIPEPADIESPVERRRHSASCDLFLESEKQRPVKNSGLERTPG